MYSRFDLVINGTLRALDDLNEYFTNSSISLLSLEFPCIRHKTKFFFGQNQSLSPRYAKHIFFFCTIIKFSKITWLKSLRISFHLATYCLHQKIYYIYLPHPKHVEHSDPIHWYSIYTIFRRFTLQWIIFHYALYLLFPCQHGGYPHAIGFLCTALYFYV